jgi:hypothetical protein
MNIEIRRNALNIATLMIPDEVIPKKTLAVLSKQIINIPTEGF